MFPHLLLFFPSFQKTQLDCLRMVQFFKNLILTVHDSDWQIQSWNFFFPAIIKKTLANYSLSGHSNNQIIIDMRNYFFA